MGSQQSSGLPVDSNSFVGRQQEIADAKAQLSAGRLLTLAGATGVGKTRLAVRVADGLSRAFPDGVWLVQLAALEDETLVPHAVVDALGIRDETGRASTAVLVEHLRDRRLLLVLDNCEHLVDACARLVDAILRAAAGVRVLATSQHRLGLIAEQILHVAPLSVPDPGDLTNGVIDASAFPAIQLFADRAVAAGSQFRITVSNQDAVTRLCRQLDGMPLAIELAAGLTRVLAIEQLVERLDDRYRLLTHGSRTALPRHRTLRAAVGWSHDLCNAREQLVWAVLSVFTRTFDLPAAEAVCAGEGIAPVEVLDAIASLVDKSVLAAEHDGAVVRYRLLRSLQQYGQEKLSQLGRTVSARRGHRDYYVQLAEEYERQWFGPGQAEIVNHLNAEYDNLRAVFQFCLATPDEVENGLRLAGTLWFYWHCRGISAEARQRIRDLAQREGAQWHGTRAKTHWANAVMTLIHSRMAAALGGGRPDPAPDPEPEDRPLPPLSAIVGGRRELTAFAVLGRIDLACTLVFRARPEQAVPLCVEALAICQQHDEQWTRSYVLRTLAAARWAMGDHDEAIGHARECLRLDATVLGPQGLSRTLDVLAAATAGRGDAERAAVLLGASDQIWPNISRGPAESHRHAGRTQMSESQARRAIGEQRFTRAFERGRELTVQDAVLYALRDDLDLPDRGRTRAAEAGGSSPLTRRERQVAELLAQGLSNKEIAATLIISQRTAESHVEHIMTKLGFTSRTQVVAWFARGQG